MIHCWCIRSSRRRVEKLRVEEFHTVFFYFFGVLSAIFFFSPQVFTFIFSLFSVLLAYTSMHKTRFYCSEFYKWMRVREEWRKWNKIHCAMLSKTENYLFSMSNKSKYFQKIYHKRGPASILNWKTELTGALRKVERGNKSSTMCSEIISHPAKISHISSKSSISSL